MHAFEGDSGQGMTGGTIAGMLLKDLILHKDNAWAKAYKPSRFLPVDKSTLETTAEIVDHTVKVCANDVLSEMFGMGVFRREDELVFACPCDCFETLLGDRTLCCFSMKYVTTSLFLG